MYYCHLKKKLRQITICYKTCVKPLSQLLILISFKLIKLFRLLQFIVFKMRKRIDKSIEIFVVNTSKVITNWVNMHTLKH